jgi:hypothetical protein
MLSMLIDRYLLGSRVYRVMHCCRGPTNGVVKAGHRHGATPLVVRAFVHPWCLVQTEGRYVIGAGSGLIIRAPSV